MSVSYNFKFDVEDNVSYKPSGDRGEVFKIEIDNNRNIKYTVRKDDGSKLVTTEKYLKGVV